jgi:hypothetical protein
MELISARVQITLPCSVPPDLTEAALAYAQAGVPVFPLRPGGKDPCVTRGFHAATTDPVRIRQWWQRWPTANLGVPTGEPSGLVVLDVDPRHGGERSLRHLQRMLDHRAADLALISSDLCATRQAQSGGGGLHLFYGWDALAPVHSTTRLAGEEGLDLRANGGYIVVSPSRLNGGGVYRWRASFPLRPFPPALRHLLSTRARMSALPLWLSQDGRPHKPREQRRRDPAYWLDFVLARCVIGNRHTQALFLACRLLEEAGLSPTEAEPWMRAYACRVPQGQEPATRYPEHDALACLAWASTHVCS